LQPILVDNAEWGAFFEELKKESDRAVAILVASYIDSLLRAKLEAHFCSGNAKVRRKLFDDANGAFATLSAKADAAFCLGFLEPIVYHDVCVIRKIRNRFAHRHQGMSLDDPEITEMVNSLQVPTKLFYDWGKVQWGSLKDQQGIVLFNGIPDEDVDTIGDLPTYITFRLATSYLFMFLAACLGIAIKQEDGTARMFVFKKKAGSE